MTNVHIFPDADQLARAAAEQFVARANEAIEARGVFTVALAGGTTPHKLYKLLASEPYRDQVDWPRVQVFWGDERCVPPDDPQNNFNKAWITLLKHVPIPKENLHRIPAELKPEQAAEKYEEILLKFFSSLPDKEERQNARFDLVLLGMGDDGHTASLFPGTAPVREMTRWVKALYVDRLAAWRVTLTPAIFNRAAKIIFLVSGQAKSWALQKVLYGSFQPDSFPAQIIQPLSGDLVWMVDEEAAKLF